MSMDLERHLRQLDLSPPVPLSPDSPAHLGDDRVAALLAGGRFNGEGALTDGEAAHLATCGECVALLVAAGEGWADWKRAEPALPIATSRRPRPRTIGLVVTLAAFAAAASAGWVVLRAPESPGPSPASSVVLAAADHTPAPASSVVAVAPPVSAAPATEPPVAHAVEPAPTAAPIPVRPVAPQNRPAALLPVPEARAVASGAIEAHDAQTFDRTPVNAAGRGFGWLRLSATPQAEIFIDDKPYGWTPLFDLRLPAGPHDVHLVYSHPDAASPDERFRVIVPEEEHWVVKRQNVRRAP